MGHAQGLLIRLRAGAGCPITVLFHMSSALGLLQPSLENQTVVTLDPSLGCRLSAVCYPCDPAKPLQFPAASLIFMENPGGPWHLDSSGN